MDDQRKQTADALRRNNAQRELYSIEKVSNLNFKLTLHEQMHVEILKDITRAFMDTDQIIGFNRAVELNKLLAALEQAYPTEISEKYSQRIKKEISDRQQSLKTAGII
jgi:hypothetical protein